MELKNLFETWQTEMEKQNGWSALFWCNHDQPRIVSRMGDEKKYWKESAKMLGTCTHLLRGTPYIFQGEELGMTNPGYHDINQYRDVESIHYYHILLEEGKTQEEALEILGQRSRDNSRTPMQWNSGKYAGFSENKSWIEIPDNHKYINVAEEEKDPDSILNYYRKLVQLRKQYSIIQKGSIEFLYQKQLEIFGYKRSFENQELLVINNLTDTEVLLQEPVLCREYEYLIGNYPQKVSENLLESLRPFESIVLYKNRFREYI